MKNKELFRGPIVLNKYGTIAKTEDPENPFVGYTRVVYGASYREFSFGGGEVVVDIGGGNGKGFSIDSGTEIVRNGPGYDFQSGGGLYTIGPIMTFHNLEFFAGMPITPALMRELLDSSYSFLISTPGAPEELVKNIYIKKMDSSYLTRTGLRWVESSGPGAQVAVTQITTETAAFITNVLDEKFYPPADTLDIRVNFDAV
jgi:hypothetical protein